MNRVMAFVLLFGISAGAFAAVKGEEMVYRVGDTEFTGYLAYDDAVEGKRPGVLVVHEWWGHTPYARMRADMLAEMGYTAFALDMYGTGKVADHPDRAKSFMQAVTANMQEAERRFDAAKALLQQQPTVDADHIAAIGYCFGGGIVLHMARSGEDLDGVVSFHGSLATATPAADGAVKARVLVFNGEADPFVGAEAVEAFEKEMQAAGADYQLVNYPGVKHSFTNPEADAFAQRFGMPLAYDKQADDDSWKRTGEFFTRIFGD
jgi:dienelactone hydrolase